ncbi:hypothetical protein Lbir_0283 [Legionella birminghamensis]|uniref:Uncharacterized protein n=1 Tax=Legionella birminghamensis TaxID=28083 RepID=A0A378JRF5_9GAMM|nr:hypothetical protein [Legionella birminghamensis]KTC75705.1 hypothetical protein Lbir_0283 [Legionella birminghamensis]STX60956.1 Uncharacterised protein [Legionella birminghamensis]
MTLISGIENEYRPSILKCAFANGDRLALLEDEETRKALLTIIRNGSTLIWHYVNLHEEYDFTQDMLFNMDKILALKVA